MQMTKHRRDPEDRWRRVARVGIAVALLALGACSDEPEEHAVTRHVPSEPPAIHQMPRLDRGEHIKPEQWLASRDAGHDVAEDAPEVAELRALLTVAGKRFREYPRMLANRAVQLETMLHNRGLGEPATRLIADLSEVPGDKRYVESFGSLSQQYYNLRLQGFDRQEALNLLKRGGTTSN